MILFLFSGCPHPHWIGDGFCNDKTNTAECDYDGGDCCVNINTDYCIECTCYHEDNCVLGYTPSVVGDGFCNDETNIENCNYDGGDCCGSCVLNKHCTECACLGGADTTHPLVGNGFCNDETNNENCNYDGGECCGTCTTSSQCTQCACLAGTDNTCHCKPKSFYYSHFRDGVHNGLINHNVDFVTMPIGFDTKISG